MDYYVYLHKTSNTKDVFYVGKGSGARAFDINGRSVFWKKIVEKHGFVVEVVAVGLQEWYAFELEKELIALYGRRDDGSGCLCNMTDGGDGASGFKMPDSAKSKLSSLKKGNKIWIGRSHSDETKQKMRKPKSEETRLRMKKPKSESMKAKLSIAKMKPVLCCNGMLFKSGKEASEWLRTNGYHKAASSAISLCAQGRLKSAYGFKWSFF